MSDEACAVQVLLREAHAELAGIWHRNPASFASSVAERFRRAR